MNRIVKFLIGVAAGLVPLGSVGQTTVDKIDIGSLLNAARTVFEEEQLVGLQAAVFSKGQIQGKLNLGYADLEHLVEVSDETRFEIASLNKTFTALALLMLDAQGRINLDAPVQNLVPEFPQKPEGVITPRLLAGGLGGIRHYADDERTPAYYAAHYEDVISALDVFKDDALAAVPGQTELYSTYGYVLLAAAIQRASGEQYQHYVQNTLLIPLGLENTGFVDVRVPMTNRSRLYSFIDLYTREVSEDLRILPTMDHSAITGGGNMYSSAMDLATFGGVFTAPDFLSESQIDEIYRPHFTVDGTPTQFSDGWVTFGVSQTPRFLFFGGSYPGATAFLTVYPDYDLAIAIVTNTWGANGSNWTVPLLTTLSKILTQQQ